MKTEITTEITLGRAFSSPSNAVPCQQCKEEKEMKITEGTVCSSIDFVCTGCAAMTPRNKLERPKFYCLYGGIVTTASVDQSQHHLSLQAICSDTMNVVRTEKELAKVECQFNLRWLNWFEKLQIMKYDCHR